MWEPTPDELAELEELAGLPAKATLLDLADAAANDRHRAAEAEAAAYRMLQEASASYAEADARLDRILGNITLADELAAVRATFVQEQGMVLNHETGEWEPDPYDDGTLTADIPMATAVA